MSGLKPQSARGQKQVSKNRDSVQRTDQSEYSELNTQDVALIQQPDANPHQKASTILQLQRAYGNQAVQHLLHPNTGHRVQRDVDNADASAQTPNQAQPAANQPQVLQKPLDVSMSLVPLEPIQVAPGDLPAQGPGDYPAPADPNVMMAKHIEPGQVVQRDDKPHPSADAQSQSTGGIVTPKGNPAPVPWSLQASAIYRNLNIAQIKSLNLDIGHEPNISLTIDAAGGLSAQYAIGIINGRWMKLWNKDIEIQLQAIANYTLLEKLKATQPASSYSLQVQAEQHIVPWFSITLNVSGTWTPAQAGKPSTLGMTGGGSALFHFDAF